MNPTINRIQVGEILVVQRFGAPVDIETQPSIAWVGESGYLIFARNPKQQVSYGCVFNWMIPNHSMRNGCFSKHPLKNGCFKVLGVNDRHPC